MCSQGRLLHFKTFMWIIKAVWSNKDNFQKYTLEGEAAEKGDGAGEETANQILRYY